MVERPLSWEYMLAAGIITATLMAGIFFMGQQLSDRKVSALETQVEEFTQEQQEHDLTRRLALNLPENNCRALNIAVRQTITDVKDLQDEVARYENSQKIENRDFTLLKKRYMNALLEYWLTAQKIRDRCGSDIVNVLYLYHDEDVCPRCEDQGVVLTDYRQQYSDSLLVFPLDASLNMSAINLLGDAYSIDQYPALIVDGDAYQGFKTRQELDDILGPRLAQNQTAE